MCINKQTIKGTLIQHSYAWESLYLEPILFSQIYIVLASGPSLHYVSKVLAFLDPNHPPYQHKYSTERQQKGPLSKSNHPPSPFADVMQGWPLRFCQAELASPSLSPSSYFLHCSFIIINLFSSSPGLVRKVSKVGQFQFSLQSFRAEGKSENLEGLSSDAMGASPRCYDIL